MSKSYPDPLALSRGVLRVLILLNLILGVFILALLTATFVAEGPVLTALGARPEPGNSTLVLGMRLIMVLGLCGIPVVHFVLTRLRAIVDTVKVGDPFVVANAERMKKIAWAVLVLELLNLAVGVVAAAASTAATPLHMGGDISLTRWLSVLLLFVLARVFEQGARMRDELEGTV